MEPQHLGNAIKTILAIDLKLDLRHQFAGLHIQRTGQLPDGLKVGLLGSVFDHGQVGTGNSGQSTEQLLGHILLIPQSADHSTHSTIIKLQATTAFLTIKIPCFVRKEVCDNRHFQKNDTIFKQTRPSAICTKGNCRNFEFSVLIWLNPRSIIYASNFTQFQTFSRRKCK